MFRAQAPGRRGMTRTSSQVRTHSTTNTLWDMLSRWSHPISALVPVNVVDGATTRRYLCGSLAQVACGDGYGVTTGRDNPLKLGGMATTPY